MVEEEHQEEGEEHQEEEEGPQEEEEEELLVVEEEGEGEGLELEDARLQPKVSLLEWMGFQEMKEAMKREGEGLKKKESLETWAQQEEYHFLLPFYDFLRPQ